MKTKKPAWLGISLAACMSLANGAQAETINLDFFAQASSAYLYSEDSANYHYDFWQVSLLPGRFGPITVAQGDDIHATVSLDSSVLVPPSGTLTLFEFFLFGPLFPSIDTGTSGTTSVFDQGTLVATNVAGTTTIGQIAHGAIFPTTSFAFDFYTADFTMITLGQPVAVSSAELRYVLISPNPVPLPAGVWLLGSGLGLLLVRIQRRPFTSS